MAQLTSLPDMRRSALRIAGATLFSAALLIPATASARGAGFSPDQVLGPPPKVSSFGKTSTHVCFLDGAYQRRPGGPIVPFEPGVCTRIWAPIPVRVGAEVVVRVRGAEKVAIRAVKDAGKLGPAQSCSRRSAGRWSCQMPAARDVDRELRVRIDYPGKTFTRWEVDIAVRSETGNARTSSRAREAGHCTTTRASASSAPSRARG